MILQIKSAAGAAPTTGTIRTPSRVARSVSKVTRIRAAVKARGQR
jgi:hypothetical protein